MSHLTPTSEQSRRFAATWSLAAAADYMAQGFALIDQVFDEAELHLLREEVDGLRRRNLPGTILESDGATLRALHGCHLHSDLYARLVRLPRLLSIAQALLGPAVYVYQFKVNLKARFNGDIWKWHQDYIYWHREDGLMAPDVVNIALFLDDVTEFNGPLTFIRASHRHGLIEAEPRDAAAGWRDTLSADLKYQPPATTIETLVRDGGMDAPKGKAGSLLVFHPNVVHASPPNLSPHDRRLLFVTYNRTSNMLTTPSQRPEWLVGRDSRPLETCVDDTLLAGSPSA